MTAPPQSNDVKALRRWIVIISLSIALVAVIAFLSNRYRSSESLLIVSYSATDELYRDLNSEFIPGSHPGISITMSHAGSVRQAVAVADGLQADVVMLAAAPDLDAIVRRGLINENWPDHFPHGSSPFYSTIVFLVRPGNPKHVADWPDLANGDVKPLLPSPAVSGAGRWAYLAAWGALQKSTGDQFQAARTVEAIYANTPAVELNARETLTRFLNDDSDVLVTWENDALSAIKKQGSEKLMIVYPPRSIRAEPVVAIVDRFADKRGTRKAATEWIEFLFSDRGQEIAAQHHLRPSVPSSAAKAPALPENFQLFTINEAFGGWKEAQRLHFDEGGTFDRIHSFEKTRRAAK